MQRGKKLELDSRLPFPRSQAPLPHQLTGSLQTALDFPVLQPPINVSSHLRDSPSRCVFFFLVSGTPGNPVHHCTAPETIPATGGEVLCGMHFNVNGDKQY